MTRKATKRARGKEKGSRRSLYDSQRLAAILGIIVVIALVSSLVLAVCLPN